MSDSWSANKVVTWPFFAGCPNDLIVFTRQLAVMYGAGTPILQAVDGLARQCGDLRFGVVLLNITWDLRQGQSLSEAFGRYPQVFSQTYCSAIREGEISGTLGGTLERLCEMLERRLRLARTLKGTLVYPVMVVLVAGFAGVVSVRLLAPILEEIASGSQQALPLTTRILHRSLDLLSHPNTHGLFLAFLPMVFLLHRYWWKTAKARYSRQVVLMRLPVLGRLSRLAALTRISATLSSTAQVGLPLTHCLQCCSEASGNEVFRRDLLQARSALINGEPLERYFRKRAALYTPMFVSVIRVGLETGELDRCALALRALLETELEAKVDTLACLFGPGILMLVGGMVGFVGLAILLPLQGGF